MRTLMLIAVSASLLANPAWAGEKVFKNGTVRESGAFGVKYTNRNKPHTKDESSQLRGSDGRFGKATLTRTTYREIELQRPGSTEPVRVPIAIRGNRVKGMGMGKPESKQMAKLIKIGEIASQLHKWLKPRGESVIPLGRGLVMTKNGVRVNTSIGANWPRSGHIQGATPGHVWGFPNEQTVRSSDPFALPQPNEQPPGSR